MASVRSGTNNSEASGTRDKASKYGTVLEIQGHLEHMVIVILECEAIERVDALVVDLNRVKHCLFVHHVCVARFVFYH